MVKLSIYLDAPTCGIGMDEVEDEGVGPLKGTHDRP
jgi:hypothetical protein